jgi:PAS domain S-box-containing protein
LAGVATRESEERFRALCNGSKQGVLVHRNHKILYVNQELADMYGYKTAGEVLLVKNSLAFLPKNRQKNASEHHQHLLNGSKISEGIEQIHIKKDYTQFWVENRAFQIDWNGKKAVCSIRYDITERTAAFAAEHRFRHLFDRPLQGTLIHRNLKALYVNKAIADMYGYEGTGEVMNLTSTVILMPEDYREQSSIANFERLNGELGLEKYLGSGGNFKIKKCLSKSALNFINKVAITLNQQCQMVRRCSAQNLKPVTAEQQLFEPTLRT